MRITNNILIQSQLQGIRTNSEALVRAQEQIATGRRVNRISDDPVAGGDIMSSTSSINAIEQYRRNVQSASSRAESADTAFGQLTRLLERAKELAVGQAGAPANESTRRIAAVETEQIFRSAIGLANTKYGDEYLFGGELLTDQPFDGTGTGASLDFTAPTPTSSRSVEIGAGQMIQAVPDGTRAFVDSDALEALRDLTRALASNDTAAIQDAMTTLDTAHQNVQQLIGETGARMNQLEMTATNLDSLETTLKAFRSDRQDVDFEAAVTDLVGRQTAFQSAMLATSRLLSVSITDYLR